MMLLSFFDTTIFQFSETFRITIQNLFLFLLIFVLAKLARKYARDLVRYFFKSDKIVVGDKELTTLSLLRQIITILAMILAIESLSVNNKELGFTEFLEYELVRINTFHISIYNLLLLVIFFFAAKLITSTVKLYVLRLLANDEKQDVARAYTVTILVQYFIYTIFLVIAIQSFGIDITILIASSAALFVGLGLGLQKIFSDIVSGFIILFEGSVKIGDIIEVDKMVAKVIEIHIRTSKVRTRDGNYLIIPNTKLTAENINNWSFHKKSTRYTVNINVAYGSDTETVRQILYDCALKHHLIDKKKPVLIFFDDFGEYALKFQLLYWTAHAWEVPRIQSDLRFLIDKSFREKGIKIPVPQREIYLHQGSDKSFKQDI